MNTDAAVICRQVTKTFSQTTAVRDLTLTLAPGKFLALLGPSGCGKTTFLRLLAGLEAPDSGAIWLEGRCVVDEKSWIPPQKRGIGFVFQDYALFPHLNVARNVAYGLHGTRATRQRRVAEVLALVGLTGLEKRMPYELSGGQQQRVALARALAPAPDIMLLDEPFSNLDAGLRVQVRQEVRRILQETHVTTILVTHDQEEAFSVADEVGVMFEGVLHQVATPRTLYETPAIPAVARFVGDANFIPATASGLFAECVLGTVPLRTPGYGQVSLMIRPELLQLTPATDGLAQVLHSTYFGHDQLVKLRLGDHLLDARLGPTDQLHPGQHVAITLAAPVIAYPPSP